MVFTYGGYHPGQVTFGITELLNVIKIVLMEVIVYMLYNYLYMILTL